VRDRGGPAGGGFDECAQASPRRNPARERDPDGERRGKDDERERDDEAGGAGSVAGDAGQEREQRERAADRRDCEAEQKMSREACGSSSRLVGARPRDGSAPAASGP
jgi:hypothetical protein